MGDGGHIITGQDGHKIKKAHTANISVPKIIDSREEEELV